MHPRTFAIFTHTMISQKNNIVYIEKEKKGERRKAKFEYFHLLFNPTFIPFQNKFFFNFYFFSIKLLQKVPTSNQLKSSIFFHNSLLRVRF